MHGRQAELDLTVAFLYACPGSMGNRLPGPQQISCSGRMPMHGSVPMGMTGQLSSMAPCMGVNGMGQPPVRRVIIHRWPSSNSGPPTARKQRAAEEMAQCGGPPGSAPP